MTPEGNSRIGTAALAIRADTLSRHPRGVGFAGDYAVAGLSKSLQRLRFHRLASAS